MTEEPVCDPRDITNFSFFKSFSHFDEIYGTAEIILACSEIETFLFMSHQQDCN